MLDLWAAERALKSYPDEPEGFQLMAAVRVWYLTRLVCHGLVTAPPSMRDASGPSRSPA